MDHIDVLNKNSNKDIIIKEESENENESTNLQNRQYLSFFNKNIFLKKNNKYISKINKNNK